MVATSGGFIGSVCHWLETQNFKEIWYAVFRKKGFLVPSLLHAHLAKVIKSKSNLFLFHEIIYYILFIMYEIIL